PGIRQRRAQPLEFFVGRPAERVEPVAVRNKAAEEPRVERLAAEPESRSLRAERLRFEVDVLEAVAAPPEARGRVAPERPPGGEMLVEQLAASVERHAERDRKSTRL